jgi:hypothetical protein
MKQDAALRTEMRTYLVEENGSKLKYMQFPGSLPAAQQING